MANIPQKPVINNQQWINGQTKLNQTNLTNGINQNITNLKTAVDGIVDALGGAGSTIYTKTETDSAIQTAINSAILTALNSDAFEDTPIGDGTGYIYVPDDQVDLYKQSTNWSNFADQIKPLSELPQGE